MLRSLACLAALALFCEQQGAAQAVEDTGAPSDDDFDEFAVDDESSDQKDSEGTDESDDMGMWGDDEEQEKKPRKRKGGKKSSKSSSYYYYYKYYYYQDSNKPDFDPNDEDAMMEAWGDENTCPKGFDTGKKCHKSCRSCCDGKGKKDCVICNEGWHCVDDNGDGAGVCVEGPGARKCPFPTAEDKEEGEEGEDGGDSDDDFDLDEDASDDSEDSRDEESEKKEDSSDSGDAEFEEFDLPDEDEEKKKEEL